MKATLAERFEAKVSPEALTGCWLWTGALDNNGYARIHRGRTPAGWPSSAHATHVAWDLHIGTPRGDLHVLHRCDTPACVAPHHLFLGTPKDNNDDMFAKGRNPKLMREFCKRGHEMAGGNLYFWGTGTYRQCRKCNNERARNNNARRPKAEPKPLSAFCGKGHEFTPENTYSPPGRLRACRTCLRLAFNRHDAKRRHKPTPTE